MRIGHRVLILPPAPQHCLSRCPVHSVFCVELGLVDLDFELFCLFQQYCVFADICSGCCLSCLTLDVSQIVSEVDKFTFSNMIVIEELSLLGIYIDLL